MKSKIFQVSLLAASVFAVSNIAKAETNQSDVVENIQLDEAEMLTLDAKQYAASYDVSLEEAMRRLVIMYDLKDQVETVANEEGENYAGSYFDNEGQFGLVVRTTSERKADRKLTRQANRTERKADRKAEARKLRREARRATRRNLKLNDADIEKAEDIIASDITLDVKYKVSAKKSLRQARKYLKDNSTALSQIPGVIRAHIDQKNGDIVFFVDSTNEEEQKNAINKIIDVPFRVENIPGGFQFTAVRGGQSLESGNSRFCTTGFAARRIRDNVKGFVIAGHCAGYKSSYITKDSTGASITLTVDAATVLNPEANPSLDKDLSFYTASTADQAKINGEFYADVNLPRRVTSSVGKSGLDVSNGNEDGIKGTTVGSYLCHFGQTALGSPGYRQSCGEVVSTTGTPLSGSRAIGNYVILRNTQFGKGSIRTSGDGTLSCFVGDSGGPVFANNTAYGIVSACGWSGARNYSPARYLAYTSIENISALGVTLVK